MRTPSKTSLFAAAKNWDAVYVAAAVAAAPDLLPATDPSGRTALHLACSVKPGSSEKLAEPHGIQTVTCLLELGADLEGEVPMDEDEGDFRATPLWYAVVRGDNAPLVKFLLQRGANASYSLWAVVWRDDEAMCRALLQSKPQLDLRAHGETPIFYAARLQRLKTLQLLMDAGANPAIADIRGRSTVDIARARRLPSAIVERLESLQRACQHM
jgi:ankyrin repeat protein